MYGDLSVDTVPLVVSPVALSPVAAEMVTWSFDDPPPMVATSVGWACIILAMMKCFCCM